MQRLTLSAGWCRALLALLLLWLATVWQFRETAVAMVTIWEERETFAHAWTVPLIALWLAWRLRGQVLAITPKPAPWVLLPMALICLVWLAGEVIAVAPATQFALVALLVLAVPAMLGLGVANLLAFPLGFLFFCVPFGEFLSPTLMHWTADFTIAALRLSGIPVYQEGLMFVIPSGRWSVIEACSGVRYLIASIMVGTLFAYLNYTSLRRRLIFVGISIIVPLVANWLRAYMIVMLGHLSGNTIAVGADHLLYGWVFFGIVIIALYSIGARWAEPSPEHPALPPATGAWPLGAGAVLAAVAVAMMALPIRVWQHIDASTSGAQIVLSLPDELPGGWRQQADPAPLWQPAFKNPSATARAAYRAPDGSTVGVFVGYYRGQDHQRKLVSSANRMVANEDTEWNQLTTTQRAVQVPTGSFSVREGRLLQVERPGAPRQHLRVWQTYWIDGGYVADNILAKLQGALGRLLGRGDDSAVLLLFADDPDDTVGADRMARFLGQALPGLTTVIAAPRLAALADSR